MVLRKMIESEIGPISNVEFKTALAVATMDIKYNRIGWLQKTSLKEVKNIATQSIAVLRKCGA